MAGSYWVIFRFYWDYIGILEKKMELEGVGGGLGMFCGVWVFQGLRA